ncbi:M20/M25/M40 family metallo-hydrolase, partial [candidate division KSB3 bacterium]|nr:M20/M25/M40 family metallo-hydrolase [candidate division KSB3 bacterium]MBD3324269.1 M20/M25/M40 family metallo-hydrolase [candidate division KSB3 bacterium]
MLHTDQHETNQAEGNANAQSSSLSPEIQRLFDRMLAAPAVQRGLTFLTADQEQRLAEQQALTEIPAPPFQEDARAEEYARRMRELGLQHVHRDDEGNVIGYWKGTGERPLLVVSAHLDTVFPPGYAPAVTVDANGILHAPGISDNGSGLAALLALIRALRASEVQPIGDIMFVGDVGEEGRGDLRGIKYLFSQVNEIDGFISIDGTGADTIVYQGLGSKRFEFGFHGPGGHSYQAFGCVPSPIHALGRAIQKIADLHVPLTPKTTFTVS